MSLRLCLFVIRLASWLVPAGDRRAWLMEWEAELRHRWSSNARLSRAGEMRMVRRSFGSLIDAAWMRRQLTRDAELVHDASHGVRLLLRSPGFTAIALVVLATGIGATTAIVSVTDALLVRPLALPDAERVVTLWERNTSSGIGRQDVAPGNALDWLAKTTSFASISAIEPWSLDFTPRGGEPEVLTAARVTPGFFEAVGLPMLHGRSFVAGEFNKGSEPAVVLSYRLWQERFGGDAGIVGRAIEVDHLPHTVVGVMRDGLEFRLFEDRSEPRLYLPKYVEESERRNRGGGYWNVIARLRAGVPLDRARQELDALCAQMAREYPATNSSTAADVVPLRDHLAGGFRSLLPLLLGAAGLLLFVACANAANLLLARGVARTREFALRRALGAGRARLIRQILAESLLLGLAAGMLALVLAKWLIGVISVLRPIDVAGLERIAIDGRVAAIASAVSLLAAMTAGIVPALQLSRPRAATALREGASGPAGQRLRGALVIVEVCVALLLVVGAGLLVRSLREVQRVDPGFTRGQTFVMQVFAWDRNNTPAKRAAFFEETLQRLRARPGVANVGAVSAMPFIEANINIRSMMMIKGRVPPSTGGDPAISVSIVAGDYFRTMGIPLIRGRLLDATDRADAAKAALVSRSAARQYWGDGDPVGSVVSIRFSGRPLNVQVVGVVGDARHDGLERPGRPELFLAHPQVPFGSMTYVVRTEPGTSLSMSDLKRQIWAVDPQQAFYRTATVDELVSRTLVGRRFNVFLLSAFGCTAVLLAAIGLYGVLSFSTRQRSREFGLRLALGARPADILRIVVREAVMLTLAGIAAGTIAALWMTRLLRGLLFGVTATDPWTFALAASGLLVVSVAACYVPARRAIRADPLVTLKST